MQWWVYTAVIKRGANYCHLQQIVNNIQTSCYLFTRQSICHRFRWFAVHNDWCIRSCLSSPIFCAAFIYICSTRVRCSFSSTQYITMPGKEGGKAKPLKVFVCPVHLPLHLPLHRLLFILYHSCILPPSYHITLQKPKSNKELDDDDRAFLEKKKAEQAALNELKKAAAAKGGFAKNKGSK